MLSFSQSLHLNLGLLYTMVEKCIGAQWNVGEDEKTTK